MEHIKSYSQFVNVDEGVKTWVATALTALSLATSSPSIAASSDTNAMEISNKKDRTMSGIDAKAFVTKTSLKYNDFHLLNKDGVINGAALEDITHRFIDRYTKSGVSTFNIKIVSKDEADKITGNFISWSEDGINWIIITPVQ